MTRPRVLPLLALSVAAVIAVASAAAAGAQTPATGGTVTLADNTATFTTEAGVANRLVVEKIKGQDDPWVVRFSDRLRPLTAGAGCGQAPDGRAVDCPLFDVWFVNADLGDRDDRFTSRLTLAPPGEPKPGEPEETNISSTVTGGDGNDVLIGGDTGDDFDGGPGDDRLEGNGSLSRLSGGDGNDTLVAGDGGAEAHGGSGDDVIDGDKGDDTLDGGPGDDLLDGAGADDRLIGGTGADELLGGPGNDGVDYRGHTAPVQVDLRQQGGDAHWGGTEDGAGDTGGEIENVLGGGGADTIVGDDQRNVLGGGAGDDIISGNGDKDQLSGDDGDDSVDGGEGDDSLSGSTGNDRLVGGPGNDGLDASFGDDYLDGGEGDDRLGGHRGADTLIGGPGVDETNYITHQQAVTVDLGRQTPDVRQGGAEDGAGDTLSGIENVIGGQGNDRLTGDGHANVLRGWPGNDVIVGGDGDDVLNGGFGSDTLRGGDGNDQLIGERDPDTMLGEGGDDQLDAFDRITFDQADPTIDCGDGNDGAKVDLIRGTQEPTTACESVTTG